MEALYYLGQQIEVPGDFKSLHYSWYSAKVLETFNREDNHKKITKKKLVIEYEKLVDTQTSIPLREIIDAERVRPKPPQITQKVFNLNQIVDVFFANGWWRGKIIGVLEGLRYMVSLDSPIWRGRFQKIPVKVGDLRVHQDWVGGRWYRIMPKDVKKDQVQLSKVGNNISTTRKRSMSQADAECSTKILPPFKKSYKKKATQDSHSLVGDPQRTITTSDISIITNNEEKAPQKQVEYEVTAIISSQSNGLNDHLQPNFQAEEREHIDSSKTQLQNNLDLQPNFQAEEREQIDSSKAQLQNNLDFQPHKLGQPNEVVGNHTKTLDSPKEQSDESVLETLIEGASTDNELDHDMSMPPYPIKCSTNQSVKAMEYYQTCDEVRSENGNVIFTKSLSVWKNIELAMEEMLMPQNPHFRPLEETKTHLREGKAVGYTLSFLGLVERTKNAQFEESSSALEQKLRALDVLEAMGFNVQHLRVRIDDLLRIKMRQLQSDEMVEQCDEEIVGMQNEEESLDSEIGEVDEKISEIWDSIIQIKKKRENVEMVKMPRSSKIDALERKVHEIKGNIQDAEYEFRLSAVASW